MILIHAMLAVAIAGISAVSFHAALGLERRARLAVLLVLGTMVALAPLLVSAEQPILRLPLTLLAGVLLMKMWDLHVGALLGNRPPFRAYLAFLANPAYLVLRKRGLEAQAGKADNLRDLAVRLLFLAGAYVLFEWMSRWDWSGTPFLVEHALKATLLFVGALALFRAITASVRLLGGYALTPHTRPLTARTPAEFWRRYNRIVGEFLHDDVFKPLRGSRHPLRSTLIVFAVSGLLHEYLFSVALGRPQGFQLLFFLLQGIAVALTLRVKPTGGAALAWAIGTFAFNILSSVLFFATIASFVAIYQNALPGALRYF